MDTEHPYFLRADAEDDDLFLCETEDEEVPVPEAEEKKENS